MRKIRIVGFGLFAVLALCALNVAPAFAESEWLVEKAKVETTLNAETEGTVTLVRFIGQHSAERLSEIVCSFLFDGTIQGKTSTILDALALEHGITVGQLGATNQEFLNCEVKFDAGSPVDCKEGSLALVWFDGLNLELEQWWLTEILLAEGTFFDALLELNNLSELVGYEIECETLIGVSGTEMCSEMKLSAKLTNALEPAPANVFGGSSIIPVEDRPNCNTEGGTRSTDIKSEFNIWAIGAELERLETEVS